MQKRGLKWIYKSEEENEEFAKTVNNAHLYSPAGEHQFRHESPKQWYPTVELSSYTFPCKFVETIIYDPSSATTHTICIVCYLHSFVFETHTQSRIYYWVFRVFPNTYIFYLHTHSTIPIIVDPYLHMSRIVNLWYCDLSLNTNLFLLSVFELGRSHDGERYHLVRGNE